MRFLIAYILISLLMVGAAVVIRLLRRDPHQIAYRKRREAEDAWDRAAELKRSEGTDPAE